MLGKAGSKQRERAVFQGGLKIHTTLEPTRQKQAERAVKRQLAPVGKGGPTGALASVEPHTGKVVALVGGRDYSKSEVNLAVLGRGGQGYQPGSSFKPFFAIAALEQGLSPRLVLNAPSSVEIRGRHCPKGWRPGGGADQSGSGGRIDMYEATARSVNTYYAQLADKVGPEAGLEVARKLGISGIPKREDSKAYSAWAVCSLVLGVKNVSVLDMAAAYGVLANDGVRCPQYTITKITGPDGKDVWKHKPKDDDKDKVQTAAFKRTMPNVTGMSLPVAFSVLSAAGIGVQVRGGFGRVSRQSPAAGTRLGANPVATLWAGGRGG